MFTIKRITVTFGFDYINVKLTNNLLDDKGTKNEENDTKWTFVVTFNATFGQRHLQLMHTMEIKLKISVGSIKIRLTPGH